VGDLLYHQLKRTASILKRILDLSKFLEFLNFEKAGLNQKMTIFDKKKSKIFSENSDQIFEKKLSFF